MTNLPPADIAMLHRMLRSASVDEAQASIKRLDCRFGERDFRAAARQSNEDPIPRLLWLDVRVPGQLSEHADAGDRPRSPNESRSAAYLARLVRELAMLAPFFDRDRDVVKLHIGGGDTGFFSDGQLRDLMESLHWHFHFAAASKREASIEVDPQRLLAGDLDTLASLGFNSLSLIAMAGQSPGSRRSVASCGVAEACAAIKACDALASCTIELMVDYGWPGQDVPSFGDALSELIALRPARIVLRHVAKLARVYGTQEQHDRGGQLHSTLALDIDEFAFEALVSAGYWSVRPGVFVRHEGESADLPVNQGMHAWLDGLAPHFHADLLGLGVGAISQIGGTCSQNARGLTGWEEAIDSGHLPIDRGLQFDAEDLLRADIQDQLARTGAMDLHGIERRHQVRFIDHFRGELRQLRELASLDLVAMDADSIRATSRGRRVMSMISACFDRHTGRQPSEPTPVHRIA